ncbi:MAG TPA: exodeoxyribonuclease VII large subunit [Thermoanaerobaculia bacterium]|jgi:exodeoxyribonuclease VII large subunit|nr:exodeoxyribonuclease VII large subunit [Thermoanaerobaculia bacterium]
MKQLPLHLLTYTVSQLGEEVRAFLGEAFPGVWVAGEVQRLMPSRNGHLFFELVEKGDADQIVGKLEAVIWRTDLQRLQRELKKSGQSLVEGMAVRCLCAVDFYPPGGRLQVTVREVDPLFTLGLLARRRQETLAALAEAGLLEKNRALLLPPVPLRVGLVTSHGSAAFHDFFTRLRESGYRFDVVLVHASMQGPPAEREVTSALRSLAALHVDCAVLVRGGGAKSDLAAFDSRRIAEAIAHSPVPVLTGLGHEIDRAVADVVAHTAFKTPTMVAEFLVRRVEEADRALGVAARRLAEAALERLAAEREAVGACRERLLEAAGTVAEQQAHLVDAARMLAVLAGHNLARSRDRAERGAGRLLAAAPRALRRRQRDRRALGERLTRAARSRLRQLDERCAGLARVAAQLAPERVLQRGFSLTRNEAGELLRRPQQVRADDLIVTRLAGGTLSSRVEPVTADDPAIT